MASSKEYLNSILEQLAGLDEISYLAMMPNANKELLLVYNVDDREFLQDLVQAMVPELPATRKKKTVKG